MRSLLAAPAGPCSTRRPASIRGARCLVVAAAGGIGRASPPRRPRRAGTAPAPTSKQQKQHSPTTEDATDAAVYDQLAALVTPPGDPSVGAVGVGRTPRGRGLVARRAVPAGETLVAVQEWHTLAVSKIGGRFGRAALADWQSVHGPLPSRLEAFVGSGSETHVRLMAWLLHATDGRRKGSAAGADGAAVWPLYRALLPRDPVSLMMFTRAERRELQSPGLQGYSQLQQAFVLEWHKDNFSSKTGTSRKSVLTSSQQRTLWAASVVHDRAFSVEADGETLSLLVPCADMANHDSQPNARWCFVGGVFRLVALRDVAPGEEVCVSYFGDEPQSNEDLMRSHGFFVPGNPHERIDFSWATFLELSKVVKATRRPFAAEVEDVVLDAAALTAAAEALARSRVAGDPHEAGRIEAARRSLERFCGSPEVVARYPALPVATQRMGVAVVWQHCQMMFAKFATTAVTDAALLVADSSGAAPLSSPRVRLAVAWRLERKRLLATVEALLKAYAARLE